ncbi:SGNH/GDSL hydrolase family protein [Inmirania thermothiophila]|uniref:Phospholipase/lecithinase/hemolysin n=1 Tax=Inmirania thermothiophila TaxID=1750597 RepID=A0A3N1Y0L8_9GAMM|nr:SGNH/GDSL hydrolase family protein [Inmirania thermothiophila]ROR32379.1 phospholipase/lecithinase/hemolysin [Inmirania thermothiophila]
MARRMVCGWLGVLLLLGAGTAAALPYTGMVVLGDSLSDGGNALILSGGASASPPFDPVPSLPYGSGRFSDGAVAAEQVASALGLPLAPSLAGGTNYALGGARTGPASGTGLPLTLADQAALYLADVGGVVPGNPLFWIWGGANDLRDAAALPDPTAAVAAAAGRIATLIGDLAAAGARHFVVLGAPDLGMTPEAAAAGVAAQASALAAGFNAALAAGLDLLEATIPGLDLTRVDVFGTMRAVAADPAAFGLADVTTPCLRFGEPDPALAVCADPGAHLFWDAIHPTAAGHRIAAETVLRALPEPPLAWLLLPGLLLLAPRLARGRGAVTTRRPRR